MVKKAFKTKNVNLPQSSKRESKITLVFSCASCQNKFPFEEAYFDAGHDKTIKNCMSQEVFVFSLYCKECVKKIKHEIDEKTFPSLEELKTSTYDKNCSLSAIS